MSQAWGRRISFSADSVLTAVVQDEDTPELVRLLGRHGDDARVNQVNHAGLTALHHGVLSLNLDAVKLLLCNGADVGAQDVHGVSPLHAAAAAGHEAIVSLLVVHGADVFSRTARGETPLDVARDIDVIRLLAAEMRRLVHREVYYVALARRVTYDAWVALRRWGARWLEELTQAAVHLWKRHIRVDKGSVKRHIRVVEGSVKRHIRMDGGSVPTERNLEEEHYKKDS